MVHHSRRSKSLDGWAQIVCLPCVLSLPTVEADEPGILSVRAQAILSYMPPDMLVHGSMVAVEHLLERG